MTGKDYVAFIQQYFSEGEKWIELPTDDPKKLLSRVGYYVWRHKLGWRFQILDGNLIVRQHKPYIKPAPKKKADEAEHANTCPVHGTPIIQYGYTHPGCFKCYFEKQQAHRNNRIPPRTGEHARRKVTR